MVIFTSLTIKIIVFKYFEILCQEIIRLLVVVVDPSHVVMTIGSRFNSHAHAQ